MNHHWSLSLNALSYNWIYAALCQCVAVSKESYVRGGGKHWIIASWIVSIKSFYCAWDEWHLTSFCQTLLKYHFIWWMNAEKFSISFFIYNLQFSHFDSWIIFHTSVLLNPITKTSSRHVIRWKSCTMGKNGLQFYKSRCLEKKL